MKNCFNIIRGVSPSIHGGETKNQDRATVHCRNFTACVCDGVTSSAHAEEAASIVSQFAPVIFNGKNVALKTLSDLLTAHRKTALQAGITLDASIPDSMKEMLRDTARRQLKDSYQTTLVCAKFQPKESYIDARIVSCGDSGFFAFSPDGELLLTNLADKPEKAAGQSPSQIPFMPDAELLTKVMGELSDYPELASEERISNPDNWLVCRPICSCGEAGSRETPVLWLDSEELLLVPKYLTSTPRDPKYRDFRRFHYSRFIRRVSSASRESSKLQLDMRGNTTAVLPDHFYTGQWDRFDDRFPRETHFLLCSDGFYRGFEDSAQIWDWLKTHEDRLSTKHGRKELLADLHCRLHQKSGDDDISFIWLSPKSQRKEESKCLPIS